MTKIWTLTTRKRKVNYLLHHSKWKTQSSNFDSSSLADCNLRKRNQSWRRNVSKKFWRQSKVTTGHVIKKFKSCICSNPQNQEHTCTSFTFGIRVTVSNDLQVATDFLGNRQVNSELNRSIIVQNKSLLEVPQATARSVFGDLENLKISCNPNPGEIPQNSVLFTGIPADQASASRENSLIKKTRGIRTYRLFSKQIKTNLKKSRSFMSFTSHQSIMKPKNYSPKENWQSGSLFKRTTRRVRRARRRKPESLPNLGPSIQNGNTVLTGNLVSFNPIITASFDPSPVQASTCTSNKTESSLDDSIIILDEQVKSIKDSMNNTVVVSSDSEDDNNYVRAVPTKLPEPAIDLTCTNEVYLGQIKETDKNLEIIELPDPKFQFTFRSVNNPCLESSSTVNKDACQSCQLAAMIRKDTSTDVQIISENITNVPICPDLFSPKASEVKIISETLSNRKRKKQIKLSVLAMQSRNPIEFSFTKKLFNIQLEQNVFSNIPPPFVADANSATSGNIPVLNTSTSIPLPAWNTSRQFGISNLNLKNVGVSETASSSIQNSTTATSHFYVQPSRKLRPIVIDGSNVAMCHGKKVNKFSCVGIELCIKFFQDRGHKEITAFVPQYRRIKRNDITGQDILERYGRSQTVVFTPSRNVNGVLISSYDDRFILDLAAKMGGVIISNDNYRDIKNEKPEWLTAVNDRLLMFIFVGDHFMVPDDPLGRKGVRLDQFLAFP